MKPHAADFIYDGHKELEISNQMIQPDIGENCPLDLRNHPRLGPVNWGVYYIFKGYGVSN